MHVVAIFCVMTVVICGALVAKRLVFCGAPYAGPLGGGSGHVGGEGASLRARGGPGRAIRAANTGLHGKRLDGAVQAWLRL